MLKSNAIHLMKSDTCEEAMKKVPKKRYQCTDLNTACYELLLSVTFTYLEDLWIVLQLQSLDMNPIRKHLTEWH